VPGPPAFVPFSANRQLCAQAGAQEDSPGKSFSATEGVLVELASHEEREVRAARNQALFRAVNEQLATLNEAFAQMMGRFSVACECADMSCVEMIEIAHEEYLAVRAEPRRFVVRVGHVYPEVEVVVHESPAYVVVEKLEAAGETAELLARREAAV
jgi:hypothetical protein